MRSVKVRDYKLLGPGIYVSKESTLVESKKPIMAGEIPGVEIDFDLKKIVKDYKSIPMLQICRMGFSPEIFTCYWYIKELSFIQILPEGRGYLRKADLKVYLKSDNEDVSDFLKYLMKKDHGTQI